jgi:hypothetical protein
MFTPNHCVFHTSLFAPKHLHMFLTGVYTLNNALNHDFFENACYGYVSRSVKVSLETELF